MLIAACIGTQTRAADPFAIHRIGEGYQTVGYTDDRTERVRAEIIIDIFLVFIVIIAEDAGCVRLLPIDIRFGMRDRERVGLQVIACESARVITVERRCDHYLVRQVAGDN